MKKAKKTREEVLNKHRLPISGTMVYDPPKNWRPTQPLPRGPQNGFMDSKGREWVKGRSVTTDQYFEWDVQIPPNDHLNVDWNGNITH